MGDLRNDAAIEIMREGKQVKKLVGVAVVLVLAAAGFASAAYWSGTQANLSL